MATITPDATLDIKGHLGDDFPMSYVFYTDTTFASTLNITGGTVKAYSSKTDGTFIKELTVTVTNAATGAIEIQFNLDSTTYVVGQHNWQLKFTNSDGDDYLSEVALLEVRQPVPTS